MWSRQKRRQYQGTTRAERPPNAATCRTHQLRETWAWARCHGTMAIVALICIIWGPSRYWITDTAIVRDDRTRSSESGGFCTVTSYAFSMQGRCRLYQSG